MGETSSGRVGWTIYARIRFGLYLALPVAAVWILSLENWRVPIWLSLFGAIGLLITAYLQAAILATEDERRPGWSAVIRWIIVVALVVLAAGFDWKAWIIEQMLVEVGAVSLAIALVAIRKAAEEGGIFHGPWLMVLVVFVLPAVGLLSITGIAVMRLADRSGLPVFVPLGVMAIAVILATTEAVKKLARFTIGSRAQLEEPFGHGAGIVLLVLWFFALLIGMPMLLSGKGS